MKKTFIAIALASLPLFADPFSRVSQKFNISEKLLRALVKHESKMNQFAIGTMPKTVKKKEELIKNLKKYDIRFVSGKTLNISIYPQTEKKAKTAYAIVHLLNIDYDLGLAQINRWNVEKRNLSVFGLLTNIEYNLSTGATILKECIRFTGSDVVESLECYNKGTDKRKYNGKYATAVLNEYKKL